MTGRLCIILLVLLVLAGCRTSQQGSTETFTIATLKGPSAMGMIRMIDSLSHIENPGLRIDILNEPMQVRKMMINGTADFAILPTTMAVIMYNKGLEYQLLAIPVWGTFYVFGSDTSIVRWADLKGKRVHVMARGMTPDVLFRYLLLQNGINPEKDITLDYSFPTHIDLANAVAAGQAELGVVAEPFASVVMQKNKQVKPIFDLNDEWTRHQGNPLAITAFVAKKKLIQEQPQLVEQVISAYAASTLWVNLQPDSAAVLIAQHQILPNVAVARAAIPRANLRFVSAHGISQQVGDYLNVFYQLNPEIIGGKIPDEAFYY
ncbi:MAG: ABC transporter substrate-binding protein [Bacteroidales bacterium]|nr:ABC transporter substrate-binding protein [Bacteroidales bacterium]